MQNWYRYKCYAHFCFQEVVSHDVCDFIGKALGKFDWTTLTAYDGAIIKQVGLSVIKGIWNNRKWKFIFHTDAQGPVLLG